MLKAIFLTCCIAVIIGTTIATLVAVYWLCRETFKQYPHHKRDI